MIKCFDRIRITLKRQNFIKFDFKSHNEITQKNFVKNLMILLINEQMTSIQKKRKKSRRRNYNFENSIFNRFEHEKYKYDFFSHERKSKRKHRRKYDHNFVVEFKYVTSTNVSIKIISTIRSRNYSIFFNVFSSSSNSIKIRKNFTQTINDFIN